MRLSRARRKDDLGRAKVLVFCCRLILGSAVLALATVETPKTVASAKTANFDNSYFLL